MISDAVVQNLSLDMSDTYQIFVAHTLLGNPAKLQDPFAPDVPLDGGNNQHIISRPEVERVMASGIVDDGNTVFIA